MHGISNTGMSETKLVCERAKLIYDGGDETIYYYRPDRMRRSSSRYLATLVA